MRSNFSLLIISDPPNNSEQQRVSLTTARLLWRTKNFFPRLIPTHSAFRRGRFNMALVSHHQLAMIMEQPSDIGRHAKSSDQSCYTKSDIEDMKAKNELLNIVCKALIRGDYEEWTCKPDCGTSAALRSEGKMRFALITSCARPPTEEDEMIACMKKTRDSSDCKFICHRQPRYASFRNKISKRN